jgi:hypothetical protein
MVWALVLFASWAVTGAHLWMWYCVPVFFAKVVLSGIGITHWAESHGFARRSARLWHPLTLMGIVLVCWCVLAVAVGADNMERNVYAKIRAWSATQDLGGQRAYGMDFGAFGYYTRLTVLDEPGLVYPPSLNRYHANPQAILLGEKPEWAFVTCYDHNLEMMRSAELSRLYEPVVRFSVSGDTTTTPDLKDVSPIWKPDFLLYKRRGPADAEGTGLAR